ncbi:MAG: prepilin-type N-terminal cleavage/methylation domain-containing protein [Glaciimonas sp.]|nr:prepilin-type N-terminal cleavage/methylation domain-containing protein [Glaciimonas sp.]
MNSTTRTARSRQRGITFIELLVSLLISFVLIAAVASLYLSSHASYILNEDRLRLQQDGRYAMLLIEDNLRQAENLGI